MVHLLKSRRIRIKFPVVDEYLRQRKHCTTERNYHKTPECPKEEKGQRNECPLHNFLAYSCASSSTSVTSASKEWPEA